MELAVKVKEEKFIKKQIKTPERGKEEEAEVRLW